MKISTNPVQKILDEVNARPGLTAMEEVLAYVVLADGRTAQLTVRLETNEDLWDLRNRKEE